MLKSNELLDKGDRFFSLGTDLFLQVLLQKVMEFGGNEPEARSTVKDVVNSLAR